MIDAAPVRPGTAAEIVEGDSLSPVAPHRIVNIGGGQPVKLLDFVVTVERAVGKTARRHMLPMQPGDVVDTRADAGLLERLTGYRPQTEIDAGVAAFVAWYRDYYRC